MRRKGEKGKGCVGKERISRIRMKKEKMCKIRKANERPCRIRKER